MQLQPWIDTWALPEMYAGIEGQGAEEVAYSTALLLEHCNIKALTIQGERRMYTSSLTRFRETCYTCC